jgi:hypothetical protein
MFQGAPVKNNPWLGASKVANTTYLQWFEAFLALPLRNIVALGKARIGSQP